jgi:hypothetical protein
VMARSCQNAASVSRPFCACSHFHSTKHSRGPRQ